MALVLSRLSTVLLLLLLSLHFFKALWKRVEIRGFIGRLKSARVRGVLRGLKDGVQPPVLVVTDCLGVETGRRRHGGLRGAGAEKTYGAPVI